MITLDRRVLRTLNGSAAIGTLGSELRHLRIAKDLSAEQLGRLAGFSQSKVSKIENSHTTPSPADVRAIAEVCDADAPMIDGLLSLLREQQIAKSSRNPAGSYGPESGVEAMEEEATHIAHYSPSLMPGLLQHPRYTEALLEHLARVHRDVELIDPDAIREILGRRAWRQRLLRESSMAFEFYLHPRCLRPRWCEADIQQMQDDYLRSAVKAADGRVKIFIAEQALEEHFPMLEEFSLLDGGRLVMLESYSGATASDDPRLIRRYLEALSFLREHNPKLLLEPADCVSTVQAF